MNEPAPSRRGATTAALVLANQLIFSASNFLFVALVARHVETSAFVVFSVIWLLVILAQNLQQNMISLPVAILRKGETPLPDRVALEFALLLGLGITVFSLLLLFGWLHYSRAAVPDRALFWSSLGCFVTVILHDYSRRQLIAGDCLREAILRELVRGGVMVAGAALLTTDDRSALLVLAAASLASAVRPGKPGGAGRVAREARRSGFAALLRAARPLGGMTLVEFVSGNLPFVVLSFAMPAQFAATRALAAFGNALSSIPRAADNYVPGLFHRLYRTNQPGAIRRISLLFVGLGLLLHAAAIVFFLWFHDPVTTLLFGPRYAEYSFYIVFVVVGSFQMLLFSLARSLAVAVEKPSFLFHARLSGAVLSAILALLLIPSYGAAGMYGALIGSEILVLVHVYARLKTAPFRAPASISPAGNG